MDRTNTAVRVAISVGFFFMVRSPESRVTGVPPGGHADAGTRESDDRPGRGYRGLEVTGVPHLAAGTEGADHGVVGLEAGDRGGEEDHAAGPAARGAARGLAGGAGGHGGRAVAGLGAAAGGGRRLILGRSAAAATAAVGDDSAGRRAG